MNPKPKKDSAPSNAPKATVPTQAEVKLGGQPESDRDAAEAGLPSATALAEDQTPPADNGKKSGKKGIRKE